MAKDQKKQPAKARRIHPIQFLRDVVAELKKVSWPTRKELTSYTLAVIVFVAVLSAVVGVLDLVFQQGFLLIVR